VFHNGGETWRAQRAIINNKQQSTPASQFTAPTSKKKKKKNIHNKESQAHPTKAHPLGPSDNYPSIQ
jgi:hypothetical protein